MVEAGEAEETWRARREGKLELAYLPAVLPDFLPCPTTGYRPCQAAHTRELLQCHWRVNSAHTGEV